MVTEDPDLGLARAVSSGDDSAVEIFIRRFKPRFLTFARKGKVPWQDCEEVAHAALATAIHELRRNLFLGEAKLASWLYRIVEGKIVDYHRTAARNPLAPAHRAMTTDLIPLHPDQMSAPSIDPETILTVREVLDSMPTVHRQILEWRLAEDRPSKQIASELKRATGTIDRKLSEAKKMFLELYWERRISRPQPTKEKGGEHE